MEDRLRRQAAPGLIHLDEPRLATEMLRGMMILQAQRAALLRMRPAPDAEEIAKRAELCARIFLNGCKTGGR